MLCRNAAPLFSTWTSGPTGHSTPAGHLSLVRDALGEQDTGLLRMFRKAGLDQGKFRLAVDRAVEESDQALLKTVRALTPLQGAVLRVLAKQGENYSPYAATSLAAYATERQHLDAKSTVSVDVPNIQTALEALQTKSLAWRAAHGKYALEEQSLADLKQSHGLLS